MAEKLKALAQNDFRGHSKGCKACTEWRVAYKGLPATGRGGLRGSR
jgi:hypothetical protein